MPPPPKAADDTVDRQPSGTPTESQLDRVREILAKHGIDADPAEVFDRAVEFARHDADSAQHQAERAATMTGRLLAHLRAILGFAGPIAAFLLQPTLDVPLLAAGAVSMFLLTGVATYLYTVWTSRPRITRTPNPSSSGWLGAVGIPKNERTPGRYLEHYVLRAVAPIAAYGAEASDNGDVAHGKHVRNQYSNVGVTVLVLTGVLSVVLLILRR